MSTDNQFDLSLIETLSNLSGVSGAESAVRERVMKEIKPFADEIQVDPLGNLLVACRGEESGPRMKVMVAAHMDEVGFMLTAEDDDGCYRFAKVGGISDKYLTGKSVWVGKEQVPGVIGLNPIHLTEKKDRKKTVPLKKLRIDVGAGSADRVQVGERAVFATPFKRIGDSLIGKAFDDRLGVSILIELIKRAPKHIDLLAAFTVQEEIGLRGARVAAYKLNPECSIVLDTTPARDFPVWEEGVENAFYNTRLGKGAAVYTADSGTISDPRLVQYLLRVGEEEDLSFQFRQPGGGRTDAAAIHRQRSGIPSVSISVPTRYLHSPVSLVRVEDYQATLNFVEAALKHLSPDILSPTGA
jgi:endoglucanase